MRGWTASTLAIGLTIGCGADSGRPVSAGGQPSEGASAVLERVLTADGRERGEVACGVLRSGILAEVFGDAAGEASFSAGHASIPHALCSASWDKPNRAELEAALTDYAKRSGMAQIMKREFNEPMPPSGVYEVALTIMNTKFDSPAAAVAQLESIAVMIENAPAEGTLAKLAYEGWVEDVGDKAAWAPRLSELSVAHNGVRYGVSVRGFGAEENRAMAIRLAQRVADAL